MGLSKWLKRQATAMAIAMSSIEKNALGQAGNSLEDADGTHQRLSQGRLSDDLLRGELSQQVKEIRWRTYKVLQETENYVTKSVPFYKEGGQPEPVYDTEGNISHYTDGEIDGYTTISVRVDDVKQKELDNLKVDAFDDYKPELCIINDEITKGVAETMSNEDIDINKPELYKDEITSEIKASHGEISHELKTLSNYNRPILVEREFRPRIELERFTKRLIVRTMPKGEKLLEFYISKYPDEFDKRTSLVVAECKKILEKGRRSDLVDLQGVGFITMDDVGAPDYLEYQYEVIRFDKIVEYDGNFVLKFIAKPVVNGKDLLEEFKDEELDERYKNKEAR